MLWQHWKRVRCIMRRLRFWKRDSRVEDAAQAPVATKFGIRPRADLGISALPADPVLAARATALLARRDALVQELLVAEEAVERDNQWRRQVALISEALVIVARERAALADVRGVPGETVPPLPVSTISVSMDPAVTVRFRIGETALVYAEDLDWAERGHQIARSDLHLEHGEISALIPSNFSPVQRSELARHLEGSVFVFATDIRDRALNDEQLPVGTLADLAKPSTQYGGWLDWAGQSPAAQARQLDLNQLHEEQERLEKERIHLLDEEAKMIEAIPVIRRRFADVDHQLQALLNAT